MYTIFIQNGEVIEVPPPNSEGVPSDSNRITPELCDATVAAWDDYPRQEEIGGYTQVNNALELPMVLVMSIWADVSGVPTPESFDPHNSSSWSRPYKCRVNLPQVLGC